MATKHFLGLEAPLSPNETTVDTIGRVEHEDGHTYIAVWRVNPNANYPTKPTVWATGLTTVTACAFDHSGQFWAAEMFAPNPTGTPGDLVRIPFHRPVRQTHLGLGAIPLPGGIAVAPSGDLFVTVNSAAPGPAGRVDRVHVN